MQIRLFSSDKGFSAQKSWFQERSTAIKEQWVKTMQILSTALNALFLDKSFSKQTENLGVIAKKCASHDGIEKKIHAHKSWHDWNLSFNCAFLFLRMCFWFLFNRKDNALHLKWHLYISLAELLNSDYDEEVQIQRLRISFSNSY